MSRELVSVHRDDYYSVAQAALELRCSIQYVRNLLSDGTLTPFKFKSLTLVSVAEVKALIKKRENR